MCTCVYVFGCVCVCVCSDMLQPATDHMDVSDEGKPLPPPHTTGVESQWACVECVCLRRCIYMTANIVCACMCMCVCGGGVVSSIATLSMCGMCVSTV